jgi:hypothetical protein
MLHSYSFVVADQRRNEELPLVNGKRIPTHGPIIIFKAQTFREALHISRDFAFEHHLLLLW